MSCTASPLTLLSCIRSVCAAAQSVVQAIAQVRAAAYSLLADITASKQTISCVLNGPVGGVCSQPIGGTLPTLATRLDALNAASISAITPETGTAIEGQTVITLAAAPDFVDVAIDGAPLTLWSDYTISGAVITLTYPMSAGDEWYAWSYTI